MIPKIIHLCWLSGEPFPTQIQQCIETWHKHLPDYEIIVWDKEKFNINSTLWTKQAYENKKYAFAADYIRLYALYKYGGIYLDSDVLVYKSFNDLLDLPYFIGLDYTESFEAAIIGAEKGTPWIGELLKRYENRSFVKSEKILDTIPLPTIFFHELKNKYKFYLLQNKISYSYNNDIFYIFHQDFFNSRDSTTIVCLLLTYADLDCHMFHLLSKRDLERLICLMGVGSQLSRFMPTFIRKLCYTNPHVF